MSAKKTKRIDEYLEVGRFVERGRSSQNANYSVAGSVAATLLNRISLAHGKINQKTIEELAAKVVEQSAAIALTLWHGLDNQIHGE
jgi:hypothetical protein